MSTSTLPAPAPVAATLATRRFTDHQRAAIARGSWSGTLNETNIEAVVARLRSMLYGRRFAISSLENMDYPLLAAHMLPRIRVQTDVVLGRADWTDHINDHPIRLWPGEQVPAEPAKDRLPASPAFYRPAYFSFSAGGWYWCSISTAPGDQSDHKDYRYADVEFGREGGSEFFAFASRAPAGKGYLHKHVFTVQETSPRHVEDRRS